MEHVSFPFLVSDIDGTLIGPDKEISAENMASIIEYRRRGGTFTLATGRSLMEARRFIDRLNLEVPIILCNGALLFDPLSRRLKPMQTMPEEVLFSILGELETVLPPTIDLFVYGIENVYATKVGPLAEAGLDNVDFRVEILPTFDYLPSQPWIKIIAIGEKNELSQVNALLTHTDQPVEVILSSDNYLEILPCGVSKGAAVTELLARLDLSPDRAAAVGDHLNDISMLQAVGLGAAVANAHPLVLQQADVIVPSNREHGVSHLIRHHLLTSVSHAQTP
jgi:Cof subfamily protein (haloacid dehalogenase superfamily)